MVALRVAYSFYSLNRGGGAEVAANGSNAATKRNFDVRCFGLLAENVTRPGTANTSVEQQSSFNFVILVLGMDYFDSGPGVRNLTQTHLLKPSELRQIATRRGGGIHTGA